MNYTNDAPLQNTRVSDTFFGEMGLFHDKIGAISARAVTHCDLYRLTRDDFRQVHCLCTFAIGGSVQPDKGM